MRRIDATLACTHCGRSSTQAEAVPGACRPVKSPTSCSARVVTAEKSACSDPPRYDAGDRLSPCEPTSDALGEVPVDGLGRRGRVGLGHLLTGRPRYFGRSTLM